jgi:DNA-binding NarL/FixJ family response regulator
VPLASPPGDERTRIVIADADHDFSEALRASVEQHDALEVVGIAKDCQEAVRLMQALKPSLVLMDSSFIATPADDTTKGIHQMSEDATVVLMVDDEALDIHTLAVPVAGFVRKSSDVHSLIDVVIAFADVNARST